MNDLTIQSVGLVVRRQPDGTLTANVPHVPYHSPDGFECGYGGSGPADLALAAMHALFPPKEGDAFDVIGPKRVAVSRRAWRLHQRFKWEFIATMAIEGETVPIEDIRQWITVAEAGPPPLL